MRCRPFLPLALVIVACSGPESAEVDVKSAYQAAIEELTMPVSFMTSYQPHLAAPPQVKPYAPRRRGDAIKFQTYAANEVRHAANRARQRGKSRVLKGMREALVKLARVCSNVDTPKKVGACRDELAGFDKILGAEADRSSAAGVSAPFPRIVGGGISAKAAERVAPFEKIARPGEAEKSYLPMRADASVTIDALVAACEKAQGEVETLYASYEKGDPELQLLAAIRKLSVESQCNLLKKSRLAIAELELCKPKRKSKELEAQCRAVCSKVKGLLNNGLEAACLKPAEAMHQEICEQPEK